MKSKVLLVEGGDDLHVVSALCKKHVLPKCFDIKDCEGISNLFIEIPIVLKASNTEVVGILIDADANIEERWNELRTIFSKKDIDLPVILPENGFVQQFDNLKLGIWIMPNNKTQGILEDFIEFLIPKDDKLLPVIKQNLTALEEAGLTRYKPKDKSKAIIHSWLAAQEDPGTPLGLSITKSYLTVDEETCQVFINWLRRLFCD